jgi:hypothetical protein
LGFGEKRATLTEILKAESMAIDDDQIYITEGTSVYIYSLTDFKLKKKFGRPGEGPEEFLDSVTVTPQQDHLLINSMGKLSYFTKDGVFIKELRTGAGLGSRDFVPIKNGFVGIGVVQEENNLFYLTINFFDSNLKKGKEYYRVESSARRSGEIKLLRKTFEFCVHDNQLFVVGKDGFIIDVLDHTGKWLYSISQEYKKRKFTSDDEKKIRNVLEIIWKEGYHVLKDRLVFPDYYPEIQHLYIDDNKIYVLTWKIENEKVEFFIFDINGKLLKRLFIPFVFQTPLLPYPYVIKNGKLYQVIENEKTESWEFIVTDIKY